MASLLSTVQFTSTSDIRNPPPTHQGPKSTPRTSELDDYSFERRHNERDSSYELHGTNTPVTPAELESHTPPPGRQATEIVQSLTNPPRNRYRFMASCLVSFVMGLNDSAPGALIPYLEKYYDISYGIVSLIFVTQACGFVLAAPFTDRLHAKIGRSKMLTMAICCQIVGYIILVCTPPFPAVIAAMFPIGLGMSWVLALNNVFIANLANGTTLLGFFHGSYGVGGTVGPLIATALVSTGKTWPTFYYLTLTVSVTNAAFCFWSYRGLESEISQTLLNSLESTASRQQNEVSVANGGDTTATLVPKRTFLQVLRKRVTLLGALFIFAYQGAEVSISGWVISYLLTSRAHPPSQSASFGYITAGFWAGITLGRFLLSNPAQRFGEKLCVYFLVVGAIAFQVLVWTVPSVIGPAVAVSLVGLLLGPIYPCAMTVFSRLLDREDAVAGLSVTSAMGSSGGAVAPFITGIVSQKKGPWVLNPLAIGLFCAMIACWSGLPRKAKRAE